MDNEIASRKLIGINRAGEKFDIDIKIGAPVEVSEHNWKCPVEIVGLHDGAMEVEDIDSFSVLKQAIGLAYHFLESHEESGGKLLWAFNGAEVSTKDELF